MSTSWHQQVVAVTGSIGSGKSTACVILQELGAFVLSADDLAREATDKNSEGLAKLVEAFGDQILDQNAALNRSLLASLVFTKKESLQLLEQIIHPIISELAAAKFNQAFKIIYPLYVYEVPLLFEKGLNKFRFKKSILIVANHEDCVQRVLTREQAGKISRNEIYQRLNAQMSIDEKKKLADVTLENYGSLSEFRESIIVLFQALSKS